MYNTDKSHSNIIKQNLKTTNDATTQTETQIEDKPPHFQRCQHTMIQRRYIKIKETYILMDSNGKLINFKEPLLTEEEETNPVVIPCGNIKRAEEILKINHFDSPQRIIPHFGINDIDTKDIRDIMVKIKTLPEA